MSKKRKNIAVQTVSVSKQSNELIASQYRYIKELSKLKYEAEEKREVNLIQQSSQMQTAFSFMTAAIFMAVPICIEYRGTLSLEFFLISVSVIVLFLITSLVLASLAQWRWKTKELPDVPQIEDSIIKNSEWEKLTIEHYQLMQWVEAIGKIQENKSKLNNRRVYLIMSSMICFYCSIISIVASFIIGIGKIV